MFKKILIANRGEVALRVIRACQELGIETVAVYSSADRDSLHVRLADEAVCIGAAPSRESYLNIPRILSAAEITDAEAIHPGYGFLAENPQFAEVCESMNLRFIGPTSEMIALLGDKIRARATMREAGIPILPGSEGEVTGADEALGIAREIGYPVMIKAMAGGGGKGMRFVAEEKELPEKLEAARQEAEKAFGNGAVYLEKFLVAPRHVEIQLMGDLRGHLIHLNERDCTIQRRHQKLIEEAPSIRVDAALRERMGATAIRGASAIGYHSLGTMEFLLDAKGNFYFMEMNTRLQVEHPVTEQVTGLDLVKEQIIAAAGEPLTIRQEDVRIHGHSIECRINAEDPDRDFLPSPGLITYHHAPGGPGVRVDSHVFAGYRVPPYYDSMIAKIIVWGSDRAEAIVRMRRALREHLVEGIHTTIPFHQRVLDDQDFLSGDFDTGYVERKRFGAPVGAPPAGTEKPVRAAGDGPGGGPETASPAATAGEPA